MVCPQKSAKRSLSPVYSDEANDYLGEDVEASPPERMRVNILGVGVSAVNMHMALRETECCWTGESRATFA